MKPNFLYLITFAYAFSTFSQGILMPIYAFFVLKLGGGILETSWAIGLYSILTGIGTILIHKTAWSHKYAKHCLWFGWLLWVLAIANYLFMTTIAMLYVSQILNAIGGALSEPVFDAEFTKQIPHKNLSGGWALFEGVTSIFYGLATLVGGFIVNYYGFPLLLHINITVAVFSFVLIAYYTYRME